MKVVVECEVGGQKLSLTTGQLAKQAAGAVLVQYGETVVFVAAATGPGRPGIDFFPLTVDYRERAAASGKFPGGFLKREGRPTTKEILTARLTDRPIRPLFPKGFHDELQIQSNVMSCDGINEPDVLSINGASAALCLSPVPFQGPIGAVRIGRIDGELIVFPNHEQIAEGDLDLIVAGTIESVLMIEGFGNQIPEDEMLEAIMLAHTELAKICKLQLELREKAGIEPFEYEAPPENPFVAKLDDAIFQKLSSAMQSTVKAERRDGAKAIQEELINKFFPEGADTTEDGATIGDFKEAFHDLEAKAVREMAITGRRLDGRAPDVLRDVTCETGALPRVHGSAVFTRGETQSLATVTLGTSRDKQRVDGLFEEELQQFMLHYYFPSFSVGECRPIRGPGRREIGHGCLAERSVLPVLPNEEDFPYTIRVISDILESNGSSSMASVCSATLALMDAGVPLRQPVAGISIGLVTKGKEYKILTDIIGDEDHFCDMDFKVAGTQKGITGIQLDLKNDGINEEIIKATLEQAKKARLELLRTMLTAIRRPRAEISAYAPRLHQTKINPEKIGLLIGPGGKTIRAIQEETGATIDIQDDGTVTVSGGNVSVVEKAMAHIEALTEEIRVGRIYDGVVSSIKEFGAFIEIAPGKDGLCHISELSDGFVKSVSDICKMGDRLQVKVIAVDDQNRVKLSRKAVLAEQAGESNGDVDTEAEEE
ncbi:polyribonucleotide nucleotidyltransferase [Gimesia maris]|uniref:Polyribonucleotide nucleotidyltransferase n=3 Tax=Gimesia maris TaxID=122 RepID=A0ABX5YP91_9PLAN|nr:polyribonucleotide nucleotidyltransferase [Gimesia maris]EDL58398.1 polynucleotide phosphorylase/polyadenylase [Gimesia maris DSM 8797]QDT79833.1 Polyribonucleotide nucleotidyltransferase [Gimesia maris]QEG17509.1 Polyribonucleotide nucleotidyltransferase [Gimesia maris]QGQ29428.1 polyribonucleotide nucleotidyltransferase [Gimesia maris]